MNTIVTTVALCDFGAGPQNRHTFIGCKWTVDAGTLHVIREGGRGTLASFADGEWSVATDGNSVVAAEVKR